MQFRFTEVQESGSVDPVITESQNQPQLERSYWNCWSCLDEEVSEVLIDIEEGEKIEKKEPEAAPVKLSTDDGNLKKADSNAKLEKKVELSAGEKLLIEKIRKIAENTATKIEGLLLMLEEYILEQPPHSTDSPTNKSNLQSVLHSSELLDKVIESLDGFELQSDWFEARKSRKNAVKKIQVYLNRLDKVKAVLNPSEEDGRNLKKAKLR